MNRKVGFFFVAFCGFFYCYLFAFCCYNCIFLCSVVLSNTRGISAIVAKIGSSSFSLDFNLRNKLISFNLSYVLYLSLLLFLQVRHTSFKIKRKKEYIRRRTTCRLERAMVN